MSPRGGSWSKFGGKKYGMDLDCSPRLTSPIERLGAFSAVWGVGIHFKVPFLERVAKRVSLKEQVLDYPPQPVITKDNVTMQIDTVVYFQITDPKLYAYGVEQPHDGHGDPHCYHLAEHHR